MVTMRECSLLVAATLSACQCFQPVDDALLDASVPDGGASVSRDGGVDAGPPVDAGTTTGACATACCQCDFGPPRPCPPAMDACASVPLVAVQRISSISAPVNGLVTVTFDGGVAYLLDVSTPLGEVRRQTLEGLRSNGRPAAVEVNCAMNRITAPYTPFEPSPVLQLDMTTDGLELGLATSSAVHPVLRSRPCFEQLAAALLAARDAGTNVLVTNRQPQSPEVFDVRSPF